MYTLIALSCLSVACVYRRSTKVNYKNKVIIFNKHLIQQNYMYMYQSIDHYSSKQQKKITIVYLVIIMVSSSLATNASTIKQ